MKKQQLKIIISSHMGAMYIETPNINELHLFWDRFEWFCFQIKSDAEYFSSLVQGIVIKD